PGIVAWIEDEKITDSIVGGLLPGNYKIKLLSPGNCEKTVEVVVPVLSTFTVQIPDTLSGYLGDEFEIYAEISPHGIYELKWFPSEWVNNPNQQNIVVQPLTSGLLKLTVQNNSGCIVREEIYFSLDSRIRVFIPDAF